MSDFINTNYSSIYNTPGYTGTSDVSADKLSDKLKTSDLSKATDDELMEVCKDFESYFVEQMFKAMQKMIPEHEDEDASISSLRDYFGDELTGKYADSVADSNNGKGLGIAQTLYEQMKRNYGIGEV